MVPTFHSRLCHYSRTLLKLLRKQASWVWEDEQEYAYRQILELLFQQFLLHYSDPTKNYQIRTDASRKLQDGLTIHFWSRSLSESELKWHITEPECLAIVEASSDLIAISLVTQSLSLQITAHLRGYLLVAQHLKSSYIDGLCSCPRIS